MNVISRISSFLQSLPQETSKSSGSNRCFLNTRLFVPVHQVAEDVLRHFEYRVDFQNNSTDPDEQIWVRTYKKVRGKNGQHYYAFARGNMTKLMKYFGHLPWTDQRRIAPLGFPLRMKIDLFSNKRDPLVQWLRWPYAGTEAQTAWGKTTYEIAKICMLGLRTIILTHTEVIRNEWIKRIKAETNIEEWERALGRRLVGSIREGRLFPITVATYQTFARGLKGPELMRDARHHTGFVLTDEAHRVPAHSFARVVLNINALLITGCTATPERRDRMEPVLFDIMGPFTVKGKGKQLNCEVLYHHTGSKIPWNRKSYNALVNHLARDKKRNKLIVNTVTQRIEKEGRKPLVMTIRVKHALELSQLLQERGFKVDLVTGTHGNKSMSAQRLDNGDIDVIVATNVYDEGTNILSLDNVHLTLPSGNPVAAQQRTGRARRDSESKKGRLPRIDDYLDDMNHWKIRRYLNERQDRYIKLGYILMNNPFKDPFRGRVSSAAGLTSYVPKAMRKPLWES